MIKGAFRNPIREVDQSGQRNFSSFDWSVNYYFTLPVEFRTYHETTHLIRDLFN